MPGLTNLRSPLASTVAPPPRPGRPGAKDQNRNEPAVAPPAGNPRFPLVDSLRAIAVGAVFWSHAGGNVWWNAHFNVGVTIFFAISGFLLYRPYLAARVLSGPPIRTAEYGVRRVLRLVPAYWLALLGVVASTGFAADALADLPRCLLFVQVYSPETIFDLIPAAWSLCVEVAFYIALPLYALAARRWMPPKSWLRRELGLLAAIAVASLAYRGVVMHAAGGYTVFADGTIPGTALWFTMGMAAAALSVGSDAGQLRGRIAQRFLSLPPGFWWALAAILFVIVNIPFTTPVPFDPVDPAHRALSRELLDHVLYGLIAGCLLCPAVFATQRGTPIQRLLAFAPLAWLGLVSYGIFLWHGLALDTFMDELGGGTGIVVAAAATVAAAALSYYAVERPLMRRKPGIAR